MMNAITPNPETQNKEKLTMTETNARQAVLTTDEAIARLLRYEGYYGHLMLPIDLRMMLTYDFDFDAERPWNCPTNADEIRTQFRAEAHQASTNPSPYNTPMTQPMIDNATKILELLLTLGRHSISQLRLDNSLCPMHGCDYAACFDDDDDECATLRLIFPSHDT